MGKKRIFIAIPSLNIGGAETALIGMLQTFDYSKVDVDLFLHSHQGPLMRYIPREVKLLQERKEYALVYEGTIKDCIKARCYRLAFAKLRVRVRMKRYVIKNRPITYDAIFSFSGDEYVRVLPSLYGLGKYDLAISFVDPHGYVLDKVDAKRTIGWIHMDYTQIDVCKDLETPVWGRLDNIISISDDVTTGFVKTFPSLESKIVKVENILSSRFVREKADEFMPEEYNECLENKMPIICSMGRICSQKNFENVPFMAKELLALGKRFHWFVIGPGDASKIEATAKELGVATFVSFIGPRSNPYPYIKACTIYAQPSLFEGKSVAVREAQMLLKPVLITNYSSASSQVVDGKDGVIVPLDNHAIAMGIADLIDNKTKRSEIVEYLATHNYGNEQEIDKIYRLAGVE